MEFRLLTVIVIVCNNFTTGSYIFEKKLHRHLLVSYNKDVRPEIAFNKPLAVEFDLVLEEVNELDVKKQILDIDAFITLKWKDPQLKWNDSAFGDIDDIILSSSHIWTPDIVLYNTGEDNPPRLHTELYKTKIAVGNKGNVKWVAPTKWAISCSCDIKWFPVDSQVCQLRFGSWSYHYKRLELLQSAQMANSEHILGQYHGVSSGEWKVTDVIAKSENTSFRCCRHPYSTITLEFHLTRLPLYYLLYTLLPLICLILIMSLIFHIDIGQRATYGVTILLAISVFLLVLSHKLPQKSDDLPWVGISFIAEYIILCVTIPLAEYTAHVAQRSHRPPPVFMLKLIAFCGSSYVHRPTIEKRVKENEVEEDIEEEERKSEVSIEKQWKMVGRLLDNIFSISFVILVIIVPFVIGGITVGDERR